MIEQLFLSYCHIELHDSCVLMMTGIWSAVPPWPTEETWIHHMIVQYPSLVVFLCIDIIISISTTTLTVAQASQVIDKTLTARPLA